MQTYQLSARNKTKPCARRGRIRVLVILTMTILIAGCKVEKTVSEAYSKTEKLFQKTLKKKDIHNSFLAVYSPSLDIDWQFAGGEFADGTTVTPDNPFYTASIGKMFTAAAVAMLKEGGELGFDDPVADYLPDSIMNQLHVLDGIDYSGQIKISQLLQHTSGLPDYFESPTVDQAANVMNLIFEQPDRFWEPWETIRFAKENMQPAFVPGEGYLYTDTEYNLLGLIVERLSGKPLHDFFRETIFEPLDMTSTSMNLRSEPMQTTTAVAEMYAGNQEISQYRSLSADWAGGGLLSTTQDLIKFQMALNAGKLVSTETLKAMQNWVPETRGMEYGFGIRKITLRKLFPLLPKLSMVGHTGSNASFMFYCPEIDVYLSGTLNQTSRVKQSVTLPVKILSIINSEL